MFHFLRRRATPAEELLTAVAAAAAAFPAMAAGVDALPTDSGTVAAQMANDNASGSQLTVLDLAAHRGKVIYVDFWASWCGPCRKSFPWMQAMQRELGGRGLVVLTVNVDAERADAERFLAEYGGTLPVVFDTKGQLAELYKLQAMPSSFLIDRQGKIRFRHRGFREADPANYAAEIHQLLDEKT